MAGTTTPEPSKTDPKTAIDKDTAELSQKEKIFAGVLLILPCVIAIILLLGYWPDRLPDPKDGYKPLYIKEIFHVRLACIPSSFCCVDSFFAWKEGRDADSTKPDTTRQQTLDTTGKLTLDTTSVTPTPGRSAAKSYSLIDLNILLMFLVALGGFLGNMIHIATSFTAFIGSGTFNRKWILWYCVKPFTAACLALGLYFVFRAGFLNYSADAASINLYGVLTIAILAGLFTDKATLKLGEVFDVVFSIKKDGKFGDSRPDPLVPVTYKFNKITPDKLSPTDNNSIVMTGENFDTGRLSFAINDEALPADSVTVSASMISIRYKIPATQAGKKNFVLTVTDEKKTVVFTHNFETL
jgi:hypothetical protein